MKNRFFKFVTKDFEDYVRAENLSHACEIFSYYYKNIKGKVSEFWMDEYAPKRKNPIYNKDRTSKAVTIN